MNQQLTLAKQALSPPDVTCAVVQKGAVVSTGKGMGVKPLLSVYNATPELLRGATVALDQTPLLRGAAVADTVIGKAAAMLLIHAGALAVYGAVMSRPAAQTLKAHGLFHESGTLVPMIQNRTGNGSCPLEQSVTDIDDPALAVQALKRRIAELMDGK